MPMPGAAVSWHVLSLKVNVATNLRYIYFAKSALESSGLFYALLNTYILPFLQNTSSCYS